MSYVFVVDDQDIANTMGADATLKKPIFREALEATLERLGTI